MKIIATDLDRTLIPNGREKEEKGVRDLFETLLREKNVGLVFVTGRYKKLLLEGMKKYKLPKPDYVIANVGTSVYSYKRGKLVESSEWKKTLARDWGRARRKDVAKILRGVKGLREQERIKLNEFKQSYYVSSKVDSVELVKEVCRRLRSFGLRASVIYSFDVNTREGLLDIMPAHGNKEDALRFVLKKMGARRRNVLFCGDSGNDLLPLTSGFYGVSVGNASSDVRAELKKVVRSKRLEKKVYFAHGNYAAGIIEGAKKFGFFNS